MIEFQERGLGGEVVRMIGSVIKFEILITIPGILQKFLQSRVRNYNRGSINTGMKADPVCFLQILINKDMHIFLPVVDKPERGY